MEILKKHKDKIILAAAVITPGGFIALGMWKAYELYKANQPKEKALVERLAEIKAEVEKETT